jgi:hypothetical protein
MFHGLQPWLALAGIRQLGATLVRVAAPPSGPVPAGERIVPYPRLCAYGFTRMGSHLAGT